MEGWRGVCANADVLTPYLSVSVDVTLPCLP